jgi:hypothetical protein
MKSEQTKVSASDIIKLIEDFHMESKIKTTIFSRFLELSSMSDDFCECVTNLNKSEFNEVLQYLIMTDKNGQRRMRDSKYRTVSQALAIYLFWLKTGFAQQIIANYFGITDPDDYVIGEKDDSRTISR